MNAVAAAAAIVIVLGAAHLAAGVLVPLLVAACVAIAFQPVARFVAARGWRPVVTSLVTLGVVALILGGVALVAVTIVGDLVASAPEHRAHLDTLRWQAVGWLSSHDLPGAARSVASLDLERWVGGVLANSMSLLFSVIQTLALVLLLTVFIQLEAPRFGARLRRALGAANRGADAERTLGALTDIQRYLLVKIASGATKAALIGLATFAFGLDYPALWAGLVFILNFLPVIGPAAAVAAPTALAALTFGPGGAAAVGATCLFINVMVGAVAEPRVLGRVVGLSPLVVVLAVALWAFVLGPVGALLAVPLTMVLKLALEQHGDLAWAARLLEHRDLTSTGNQAA